MRLPICSVPLALGALVLGRGAEAVANAEATAAAAPRTVLAGRVDGVTTVGDGVAALRAGEAVLLDAQGRIVGRCRGESTIAGRERRRDGTTLSREEVLGEAGFSDEDVSPEAEDLLEDEGLEPRARRAAVGATSGAPRALALAGTADGAWVGTADGLWRLDARAGACTPAGLGGQEISLVAARGAIVLALADLTVWRSRDGGTTFDVAAVLTSPAHALTLAADGETALLADDDGVVEVGAARGFHRRLDGRVDALAACGLDVVVLADDGVHRLDAEGGDLLSGPRPPVRALSCGADGLVAVGVGVWTSPDGAAWREEPAAAGRSFSGVAYAAGRPWLAGEDGLAVLDAPDFEAPDRAVDPRRARGPIDDQHPPAWAGLLPRVAIAFDGWTQSTGVAGWRLWVRLTVSLGRRWQRTTTENLEDLR
jgi:hypothetical protein